MRLLRKPIDSKRSIIKPVRLIMILKRYMGEHNRTAESPNFHQTSQYRV